jgi:hypothetical protein
MPKSRDLNIDNSLADVVGQTRRPKLEPETGWYKIGASESYAISFNNSWGNVGVLAGITNAPASFYLSDSGEVRCRGKIDGGSAGTVVFILPDEVRPEYAETFICAVDGGGKANVTVHANGQVIVDTIS